MDQPRITGIRHVILGGDALCPPWNLIRVDTDQGVWGLGEAYWGYGLGPIIDKLLSPLLVGENPLDVDRLFSRMWYRLGGANALNGTVMTAMSGIEIALWDAAGRLTGLPVYRLLGGKFRDRVRMYRTGTPEGAHERSVCEEYAAKIRGEGWTAIKTVDADSLYERYDPQFRLPGHQPLSRALVPEDFRLADTMTANMRAAFGDDFDIAVHCHWACSLRDARRLAEVIAPYRPMWLEDPLPPAWSPAWRILTEHSPVPICMGENLYSRHEFRPFIEEHGTDIVHIDVPKSGGLLEARRIADHADLHYLSTSFHNAGSVVATVASAHVAATIREFGMIERAGYDLPWWEDLVEHDGPIIEGGYIRVPEGPGLGVRLNEDVARAHLADGESWWE